MDGHCYLMDDFISLYYSWYLGWLFLHILFANFFDGLWPCAVRKFCGQPISVDDSCVMRKHGSWDLQ